MTLSQQIGILLDTYVCQNCNWYAAKTDPGQPPYEIDIPDLPQRVSSGDIHPAGTCPACGALVQGLFDDLVVVDAEAGRYFAHSAGKLLSYTGMAGPQGLRQLQWLPLLKLPHEPLAQLVNRHRRYLAPNRRKQA